jgi:threonine aldolase
MPKKHPTRLRQFASDNYAGICPEVIAAIQKANQGHVSSYGEDPWTREATELIQEFFGRKCDVFFVFNGTAANSLALASACDSYQGVLCHEFSHVETDECNAPGFFAPGTKLIPLSGENGKFSPLAVERAAHARGDVHYPEVRAVTLAQATELGTIYSESELKQIGRVTKKLGLTFHMDGARIANAIAELDVKPRKITCDAGVDIVSLGGTKNGLALGEAVVFFNPELAENFKRRCKQAGQLASKMRFLAAQWVGLLKGNVWLKRANHANQMAKLLENSLRQISSLRILYPRQANAVFVDLSPRAVQQLFQRGWHFYTDVGPRGARLMCSWDSTEKDVKDFIQDLRRIAAA